MYRVGGFVADNCRLQFIQDEACHGGSAELPAHDAPSIRVDHEGDVNEAQPGVHEGEADHPSSA